MKHVGYWQALWNRYKKKPSGVVALFVLALFVFVAAYAPFLASSKPLCVAYDGHIYFPLFRYLLSSAFYSKKIDLFFNLLGLFIPLVFLFRRFGKMAYFALFVAFVGLFTYFGFFKVLDPALSARLEQQKQALILQMNATSENEMLPRERYQLPSWDFELEFSNDYAKLNLVLDQWVMREQHERLVRALKNPANPPPTLYQLQNEQQEKQVEELQNQIVAHKEQYLANRKEEERLSHDLATLTPKMRERLLLLEDDNRDFEELQNRYSYLLDKRAWLNRQLQLISLIQMPLIRPHHWEDTVGGEQALNIKLPFIELSRINRKDLTAALIFGSRISLFVGLAATILALVIGVPLGLLSGYYGSKLDIFLCRFVEVWEAMPVFFMLLLIVAITQSKSIFVVIAVLSVFSWMSAFRFVRAEAFRQREMLYVDATRALGFPSSRILLGHILPNSILAVLALLPFDIMGAVTREAGLAFLGLGEEQSCSWGVLMDEGRSAFPAESNLLWPPSIVLTVLLIAIAFIGQRLQEAMDPKSADS